MTNAGRTTAGSDTERSAESGDTAETRGERLPGDGSMWVFVLGDLTIFTVYFVIFMVYRSNEQLLFLQGQQHLDQTVGVINTLVLLASSWCLARSVRSAHAGQYGDALRLTVGSGVCGVLFMATKIYEWSAEIHQGLTVSSNNFFMFYYMLTGVHMLHVVMGLIILSVVYREIREPTLRRLWLVEAGATYWHMVDVLWIVIFALVYVVR